VAQKPDTTLVRSAINGDTEGFTELCQRYYPAMVAIEHSILGDRHLAEDAAQQAFAKAAVKLPQLKKESRFANWLAFICRNVAKDIARRTENLHSNDELSIAVAKPSNYETAEVVRQAISKLSAFARKLIFLRYYDGMSSVTNRQWHHFRAPLFSTLDQNCSFILQQMGNFWLTNCYPQRLNKQNGKSLQVQSNPAIGNMCG
jgi:RNA polymerase sigma-70 factor (ECF subfamily)